LTIIDIRRKPEVRADFVPVDAYVSRDYVELEKERLWPKTWLLACREEEVENVGDYVTFDIADESIIILRSSEDRVEAFYNVCQHRGRRLKDDYGGNTGKQIVCSFHGWRYRLTGEVMHVPEEQDWAVCPQFKKDELGLKPVRMDTWGGWVWVTMDPDIEPLLDYLSPVPEALAPYEFENHRIAWHQAVVVECNWKVTVDAFNEAYHAHATHSVVTQPSGGATKAHGRHGEVILGFIGAVPDEILDVRGAMIEQARWQVSESKCMSTVDGLKAAEQLLDLPAGTSNAAIFETWVANFRQILKAKGVAWPEKLTTDVLSRNVGFWHVFPNTTFVPEVDATLWHRMRPYGNDPDRSIWDVWSLVRPAPGHKARPREFFPSAEAYRGQNPFLEEDISNMEAVQKGMLSRGFHGARTNPDKEVTVSNFHKTLYDYIHGT
jgi:phenylpropionate dioxygenase-like ring-hydroxylating dioxygenase large terminal subunit